ncbi:DUF4145 domain-containing protein [Pedobacter africanus]|uniref:Uncharacterized protein n=1 Tax=Pedobacter africanus TaxID=151894 RepID=A0ACC6KXU4_9SPHI|nr:DUF4145 domain-containing protein [Pedobacter africanus]MDR6784084.1 hypothetical protein [Pedobacter africanus]
MLFEKKKSGEEIDYNFFWVTRFQLIECAGCENISFLESYGDSFMMTGNDHDGIEYYENAKIYPPYLKNGEELKQDLQIPQNIRNIYRETVNAFKIESLLLTAAGFRAVIEAICNHLKIKQANLADRIDLLHSKGHLSKSESRRLHSIRFLGNKALHEIETPKPEQLVILLNIINHLLSNLFINDKMMKDKLDIVVDTYEEFTIMLQKLVKKEISGTDVTIDSILGKSKHLVSKKNYTIFMETFIKEVKAGKFDFLKIADETKELFHIKSVPKLNSTLEFDI